jgi:hypothetical protein
MPLKKPSKILQKIKDAKKSHLALTIVWDGKYEMRRKHSF